jgi:hypothetical protein
VGRVGVLGDVEILLDDATRVSEEWPRGTQRVEHLVRLEQVVGADRDDLGVGDLDLRVQVDEVAQLPSVLGAEVAP